MTKYREIIRLTGLGFSQRNIMASCGVAQKTVVKVQKRARELRLVWPLDETMTDVALEKLLFPKKEKTSSNKRMPDFAYIRKELLRNGVSKKLLWTRSRNHGLQPISICTHSLAMLPKFSYQTTAKQLSYTMVVGKTSRSMKPIRKWLSTMELLSFQHVSELPGTSRMLRERWEIFPPG